MINPELHKTPVALDREKHRHLKLNTGLNNLEAAQGMNAFFVTAAEFADTCKEYPVLFLPAGKDAQGVEQVAPVAVFGVAQGENLFIKDGRWDAYYIPAVLRAYPFTMARIGDDQFAVCFDEAWKGFSQTEGTALFDDKGEPAAVLNGVREFVEQIEVEIERTRLVGQKLMEMKLLQPKRFDAKLPDGSPLTIDGFYAVDEERLAGLTDAELLNLHRSGIMGLLHSHQISLGNMRRLIDKRIAQSTPAAA